MKKGAILVVLLILLALPIVSAEIVISQPKSLYNLGDKLDINVTLKPSVDSTDFLKVGLSCNNQEVELYKSVESLSSGEEKRVLVSSKLEKNLIGNVSGVCFMKSVFANEEEKSQVFEISSEIDVDLSIEGAIFAPGETVSVKGSATKANGNKAEGFVEISIEGLGISRVDSVSNGEFQSSFILGEESAGGEYNLVARAYEKSGEEIANSGSETRVLRVRAVLTSIKTEISAEKVKPENTIDYKASVFDQTDKLVENQEIALTVYSPNLEVFKKEVVNSGEAKTLQIEGNYAPGYWSINAKLNELEVKKEFFVEEFEKVEFSVENNTLIIKNVGNVIYRKPAEISIGNVSEVVELNLNIGEEKKYRLYAPDGNYKVLANSGASGGEFGSVFLTGNAVNVRDAQNFLNNNFFTIIWAVIIIVLIIVALIVLRRVRKKGFVGRTPTAAQMSIIPKTKEGVTMAQTIDSSATVLEKKTEIKKVENLSGREKVSIIALNIKNLADLKKISSGAIETIREALISVKDSGARIYAQENYRMIVFAPSATKLDERGNNLHAIKKAKEIEEKINKWNSRAAPSDEVDFGIGCHVGEMIMTMQDGKARANAVGNTVTVPRRIAEASRREVLMSDQLHRIAIGSIRSEQTVSGYWRINKISDRDKHKNFLERFSDANKSKAREEK